MALQRVKHRLGRAGQRGVTLIELIVGVFIALFLTAAAVAFAAHETRLMGISRERLDLSQSSRAAIDLIADDISQAGAGVGYAENGDFGGLLVDNFTVGGVAFNTLGGPNPYDPPLPPPPGAREVITLAQVGQQATVGPAYTIPTVDLGIRFADGSFSTMADYGVGGTGQVCMDPDINFRAGELVVFRTADGLSSVSAVLNPGGFAACAFGTCTSGCQNITWIPDPAGLWTSGPGSNNVSFRNGEVAGGLKTVVWFVSSNGAIGTLRRAVFDAFTGCGARDANCGGAVAEFVETLQIQVWHWDTNRGVAGQWVNAGQIPINNGNRIRVDVEMVMRSRTADSRQTAPTQLRLRANTCVPNTGACNALVDFGDRSVFRTSVLIQNTTI